MDLTVLGCAGGVGGRERLSTCLQLDRDILLDAGTGIAELHIDDLVAIDHVFLTHSHLDHHAGLAFMLDAVLGRRDSPVVVHAIPEVIAILREHLYNWFLWPDFAVLPHPDRPMLRWAPCLPYEPVAIDGRVFTAFPVDHTVPAVAYQVLTEDAGFVFSGDMSGSPELWAMIAAEPRVQRVIVDCSFPDFESEIAGLSKHYCPRTLLADTAHISPAVDFHVTHLKPGSEDVILHELRTNAQHRRFHRYARRAIVVLSRTGSPSARGWAYAVAASTTGIAAVETRAGGANAARVA